MPRSSRAVAQSGFYHITLRGNGKQILFETDTDRFRFLDTLKEALNEQGVRFVAWCLMENHVHLIVDDPNGHLSKAIQKTASSYAAYFNAKHSHSGHVFQGRFNSSPIDQESYLLQAIRYVLRNPVKAGVAAAKNYRWSSYSEIVDDSTTKFTDNAFVESLFGGQKAFSDFINSSDASDYAPQWNKKLDDTDAPEIAKAVCKNLGIHDPTEIKSLSKIKRNAALRALSRERLTNKQIERLTGVGRGPIQRACGF